MDSYEQRVRMAAGGDLEGFSLFFTQEAREAVTKGEVAADDLLVAKTRELMAATGEADFRKAFERVASVNREVHEAYLNRGMGG